MKKQADNLVRQTETVVKHLLRYEWLILMGATLAVLAALNVLKITNINPDFFWMIAGIGIGAEAFIEIYYEKRLDKVVFNQERAGEGFEKISERMNDDPAKGVVTLTHGNLGITMTFLAFRKILLQHEEGKK